MPLKQYYSVSIHSVCCDFKFSNYCISSYWSCVQVH